MSLTVVSFGAAVRIGGEYDGDGQRGFVLLAATPSPALLTPRAARQVARTLVMFAERVRPATGQRVVKPKERKERPMDENRRRTHDPGRKVHHA
jgi:hypothetical protein